MCAATGRGHRVSGEKVVLVLGADVRQAVAHQSACRHRDLRTQLQASSVSSSDQVKIWAVILHPRQRRTHKGGTVSASLYVILAQVPSSNHRKCVCCKPRSTYSNCDERDNFSQRRSDTRNIDGYCFNNKSRYVSCFSPSGHDWSPIWFLMTYSTCRLRFGCNGVLRCFHRAYDIIELSKQLSVGGLGVGPRKVHILFQVVQEEAELI